MNAAFSNLVTRMTSNEQNLKNSKDLQRSDETLINDLSELYDN